MSPASDQSRFPRHLLIGSGSGPRCISGSQPSATDWTKHRELAILTALDARIPIPTAEDQEAARTSGREANAALFATLRDKHRALADLHRREC